MKRAESALVTATLLSVSAIAAFPTSPFGIGTFSVAFVVILVLSRFDLRSLPTYSCLFVAFSSWYLANPLSHGLYLGTGDLIFHVSYIKRLLASGVIGPDPLHGYDKFPVFAVLGSEMSLMGSTDVFLSAHIMTAIIVALGPILFVGLLSPFLRSNRMLPLLALLIFLGRNNAYQAMDSAPRAIAFVLFLLVAYLQSGLARKGGVKANALGSVGALALILTHPVLPLQMFLVWGVFLLILRGRFSRPMLLKLGVMSLAALTYLGSLALASIPRYFAETISTTPPFNPILQSSVGLYLGDIVTGNVDSGIVLILAVIYIAYARRGEESWQRRFMLPSALLVLIYLPTPLSRASLLASSFQLWRWSVVIEPIVLLVAFLAMVKLVRHSRTGKIVAVTACVVFIGGSLYNPLIYPNAPRSWALTPLNAFSDSEVAGLEFGANQLQYLTTDYLAQRYINETSGIRVSGAIRDTVCSNGEIVLVRAQISDRGVLTTFTGPPPGFLIVSSDRTSSVRRNTSVLYDTGTTTLLVCRGQR